MIMTIRPLCMSCVHLGEMGMYCLAFPDGDGIPNKILDWEADHREPFPGDRGIRFVQDDRKPPPPELPDDTE